MRDWYWKVRDSIVDGLVNVTDVNRVMNSLKTAYKVLTSSKVEYERKLHNILEINLICVDKDDLVEFLYTKIFELESVRNDIFELYSQLIEVA